MAFKLLQLLVKIYFGNFKYSHLDLSTDTKCFDTHVGMKRDESVLLSAAVLRTTWSDALEGSQHLEELSSMHAGCCHKTKMKQLLYVNRSKFEFL